MNIIFICYGVPCLFIYFLTVISIISIRKQLSSSFVVIYCWTTAVNLLTYFNAWVAIRLTHEQWLHFYYHFANALGFLPFVHLFLVSYLYFAQNINSLLLTLDRFFAIVAITHNETWKRYYLLVGIFLYLMTFIPWFCIGGGYSAFKFEYNFETHAFSLPLTNTTLTTSINAIFGVSIIIMCISLSLVSWKRLRSLNLLKKSHSDRSFFFISFCNFVAQALNVIILITCYYFLYISFNFYVLDFIFNAMHYTSDIFSLGPGIYTILVPGPIRRKAISILTLGYSNRRTRQESVHSKHTI